MSQDPCTSGPGAKISNSTLLPKQTVGPCTSSGLPHVDDYGLVWIEQANIKADIKSYQTCSYFKLFVPCGIQWVLRVRSAKILHG